MLVGINLFQAGLTYARMIIIKFPTTKAQRWEYKIQQPFQQGALVRETGKHDSRKESACSHSTKNRKSRLAAFITVSSY